MKSTNTNGKYSMMEYANKNLSFQQALNSSLE